MPTRQTHRATMCATTFSLGQQALAPNRPEAGTTVRASVDTGGGDPNGASSNPSISADGQHVAFHSFASDLVAGDGNGFFDVFVRDLVAGTTVRASVDTGGGDPNGYSLSPSISADGQHVAFHSQAGDLVPGRGDMGWDLFVSRL